MELPSPRAWLRQRSEALDSLQELLSSLKASCPFRKHWGEEKEKKISALAKIFAPRIYLVWLPPCRLAITGSPLPLCSFRWTKWALSRAKRDVKPAGLLRGLGAAADVLPLIRTQDVKDDSRVSPPR